MLGRKLDLNQIPPFILEIIIFLILTGILKFIAKKLRASSNRLLNPKEYFPEEELHSLKQIFYLIMMALCFINVLYSLVFTQSDIIYLTVFDVLFSLYIASTLDISSLKNKILLILLIPYGSLTYILFGDSMIGIIDFIHTPVFIYLIKLYYDKFREYTQTHGLGLAIIALFTLVFISFLITQIAEGVNALDALVMVSNAFTSNGYTILGGSIVGKIDDIILVWGGYVLSGVGTATLTAGILTKHFNNQFKELNDKIDALQESNKNDDD